MPNRYLRESFVESERVNAVSLQAELLWLHLLTTVDDWGRSEAHIKILRPRLFPLRLEQVREADMQRWIAECEKAGLVRLYESSGKQYLQMMRWEKGRAEKSKHPEPPAEIADCCFLRTSANSRKQPQTAADDGKRRKTFPPTPTPISDSDTDSLASAPVAALALVSDSAGKPAKTKKPRQRNELLDALAAVDGSNLEQVTPSAWSGIAKHLADIKSVSPDVTAAEIARRASNYRQWHKEWPLTPGALAKHWASCDRSTTYRPPTPTAPAYAEPVGWKAWLNHNRPESAFAANGMFEANEWSELDRSTQGLIAAEMAKERRE